MQLFFRSSSFCFLIFSLISKTIKKDTLTLLLFQLLKKQKNIRLLVLQIRTPRHSIKVRHNLSLHLHAPIVRLLLMDRISVLPRRLLPLEHIVELHKSRVRLDRGELGSVRVGRYLRKRLFVQRLPLDPLENRSEPVIRLVEFLCHLFRDFSQLCQVVDRAVESEVFSVVLLRLMPADARALPFIPARPLFEVVHVLLDLQAHLSVLALV